jgi:hypothetical protein
MENPVIHPALPLQSSLYTSRIPLFSHPDYYGGIPCFPKPPNELDERTIIKMSYPFDFSLDLSQNVTFVNVTLHVVEYGRNWSAQPDFELGISQLWFKEKDAGIIAIQTSCQEPLQYRVAPDDWSWPWVWSDWPYPTVWTLYTSNTTDHGWLFLVQDYCDVLVNNVASSTIFLDDVSFF